MRRPAYHRHHGRPQRMGCVSEMATRVRWPVYWWPMAGAVVGILLALTATAWSRDDRPPGDFSGPVVGLLWRTSIGQLATGPPAVTADGIIVGGADGRIRAFHRTDGRLKWTFPAASGRAVYTRVADGVVYATTAGGGAIVAVDAETGKPLWDREVNTTFGARPAVGKERVYAIGGDDALYALRRTGLHRYWRKPIGGDFRTTPVVIRDIAVVAGGDGRLYGLDSSGDLLWKPHLGRATAGPIVTGHAVCVPLTDGSVRCVQASDGKMLGRITLPGTALLAPTGGDGWVFAAGADRSVGAWDAETGLRHWLFRPPGRPAAAGTLVRLEDRLEVAYGDGQVLELDATTGTLRWEVALPDRFDLPPRLDDTALYLVSRTGILYALQPPGFAGTATTRSPARSTSPSPRATRTRPWTGTTPSPATSEPPASGATSGPPPPPLTTSADPVRDRIEAGEAAVG